MSKDERNIYLAVLGATVAAGAAFYGTFKVVNWAEKRAAIKAAGQVLADEAEEWLGGRKI